MIHCLVKFEIRFGFPTRLGQVILFLIGQVILGQVGKARGPNWSVQVRLSRNETCMFIFYTQQDRVDQIGTGWITIGQNWIRLGVKIGHFRSGRVEMGLVRSYSALHSRTDRIRMEQVRSDWVKFENSYFELFPWFLTIIFENNRSWFYLFDQPIFSSNKFSS